jgi:tartrate/fumarate subfamily iron-sulfur-dependent hydro-lyase beta chain
MSEIALPLDEERARRLRIGDIVRFNGKLFTGRSSFYIRAEQENILPPLDYDAINVMMHVGPVMETVKGRWRPISLTPTTSIRMEKYAHKYIRKLKTRGIIGKGTMGEKTTEAMVEVGSVHLCGIGINANVLGTQVKEVVCAHYVDEIGPTEATWVLDVEHFGPFVVDIDAEGNNLFSPVNARSQAKMREIWRKHGIPLDYRFTPI